MPGIGTTLFSSPKRAGIYARRLNRCMNFLTWVDLKHTRIKRNSGSEKRALTGWVSGIPRWDPE
jgi:hypothetical protein